MLRQNSQLLLSVSLLIISNTIGSANAQAAGDSSNKEGTKNENVAEAQKLNGAAPKVQKKTKETNAEGKVELGAPSVQSNEKNKADAKDTASVVNQVPGVKVDPKDLEPPTGAPIKGFHPIKKLLRPVENLEGMSIKLEQQVMKLEGPIAGLQHPMINLQRKMTKVDSSIGSMQGQLNGVQNQVTGVRSDLSSMRKDIEELKSPIKHLEGPIAGVAKPLEALEIRLNLILIRAILIAALGIAVGTPIAAVLLYKNRHKLGIHDRDLPKAAQPDPKASLVSSRRQ